MSAVFVTVISVSSFTTPSRKNQNAGRSVQATPGLSPERTTTLLIKIALVAIALTMAPQAHQQPQDARKPCIGVIVRVINPGVEIVRQKSGKLCQRPAAGEPSRTKVGR